MPVSTIEAIARMQSKLAELGAAGCHRVLIYGAGRHTLKVGEALGASPIEIVGIIDDHRGGKGERLWNWPILTLAESLDTHPDAVIISSDGQERRLYAAGKAGFAKGRIPIHCLYGGDSDEAEAAGETFTDETGQAFPLIPGYRRRLKPRCDCMISRDGSETLVPTAAQAMQSIAAAQRRVGQMSRHLAMHDFDLHGKDALEVGCSDGSCTFALAGAGCHTAIGIDEPRYLLADTDPSAVDLARNEKALRDLKSTQTAVRAAALGAGLGAASRLEPPRLQLLVQDLTSCGLPDASFDLICSWQTLEHIVPPEAGFAAMARLLRPGGFCFHEYEAFSSRSGGHTLCTLDIPWGHVRLSGADVERYLSVHRSREYAQAIQFYRHFLNRLLLADLPRLAQAAGLNLVARTPWLSRDQYEEEFQSEYLVDARRHYPTITLEDMTHQWICVLLQKPVR